MATGAPPRGGTSTRERLLAADRRLSTRLRYAEQPGPLRMAAIFLAHSGDSWFWGIGLLAAWWLGSVATKALAVRLLVAIAILAVLVFVIKRLVRRQRPAGEWGGLYRRTDPHSFPSGHAARMAMLAVLGVSLGPPWFGILLLGWAPLVALARVAMGVHYLSDVAGGALLGLVAGLALAIVWR
jgi:undecaprenyl-diphosphatase